MIQREINNEISFLQLIDGYNYFTLWKKKLITDFQINDLGSINMTNTLL
jgi:hypothetical protein